MQPEMKNDPDAADGELHIKFFLEKDGITTCVKQKLPEYLDLSNYNNMPQDLQEHLKDNNDKLKIIHESVMYATTVSIFLEKLILINKTLDPAEFNIKEFVMKILEKEESDEK